MDFKQLRSFVAVADCGSFTQAAAQLYTSQPTISAHIRQLEEELQQRLFLRTTKSLSITPHGRELYDYAVQVLSASGSSARRLAAGRARRFPRSVHHPLGLSPARSSGPLQRSAPGHHLRHPPERQLRRAPRAAHRPVRPWPHRHGRAGRRLVFTPFYQDAMCSSHRTRRNFPPPRRRICRLPRSCSHTRSCSGRMAAAASAPPTNFSAPPDWSRTHSMSPHG